MYNQLEKIPCEVKHITGGLCSVTFTMPENQINAFVLMLTSLSNLFRGLGWRAKTNLDAIHERNQLKEPQRQARLELYEKETCAMYKEYINKGNTPRESLSLTVSQISNRFEFSSYDIVKTCLTKNKLLKNTGFYASRHKLSDAQ